MIRLFFLIPIIMSLVWLWYLKKHDYTLKQGLIGFGYIVAFNLIIVGFFSLMIYLTQ